MYPRNILYINEKWVVPKNGTTHKFAYTKITALRSCTPRFFRQAHLRL